jgi:hypothetical protein
MKQTIAIIAMILFLAITINVQADDSIYSYAGMDAANTNIYKSSYKMSGKGASMAMYNCSGCECRDLYFNVAEFIYRDAPGAPVRENPTGYLDFYSYNNCTGAYGNGYAQIELTAFNISNQLDSAYAEGFGTIYAWAYEDFDDTSPDYSTEPVNIKVTWTGISDLYTGRNKYTYRDNYPDGTTVRYTSYSDDSSREASATGFLVGEATNVLISTYANIFKASQGSMEMIKYPKNTSPRSGNYCLGNFDSDNDVDGSDALTFKADFGRSSMKNPCPNF